MSLKASGVRLHPTSSVEGSLSQCSPLHVLLQAGLSLVYLKTSRLGFSGHLCMLFMSAPPPNHLQPSLKVSTQALLLQETFLDFPSHLFLSFQENTLRQPQCI